MVPVPTQGQVNLTVFLGSELVLRIPRTTWAAEQLSKEAQVIALVRDAGVPTPNSYATTRPCESRACRTWSCSECAARPWRSRRPT